MGLKPDTFHNEAWMYILCTLYKLRRLFTASFFSVTPVVYSNIHNEKEAFILLIINDNYFKSNQQFTQNTYLI